MPARRQMRVCNERQQRALARQARTATGQSLCPLNILDPGERFATLAITRDARERSGESQKQD
jgi:hypothetical protein